jgi:thiamine biosynthesis protein ThiS
MSDASTDSRNADPTPGLVGANVSGAAGGAGQDSKRVEVVVNGDVTILADTCSVADLLASLEMSGRRVAVAVNRDIVVRSSYPEVQLASGDRIEILEAVGGG